MTNYANIYLAHCNNAQYKIKFKPDPSHVYSALNNLLTGLQKGF